jgi:hypothetical protein
MPSETFEFIDGIVLPQQRRGRPRTDSIQLIEQLITRAIEGLQSGKYRTRYHAAVVLSVFLNGASKDADVI